MDINQKNTQILCKCMSEMDEPSTIHKIAQHAISRMNIGDDDAALFSNEVKKIVKMGAESGFIFQKGQKYSCQPIDMDQSDNEENEMTDALATQKRRRTARPRRIVKQEKHEFDDEEENHNDLEIATEVKKNKRARKSQSKTPAMKRVAKKRKSSKTKRSTRRRRVTKRKAAN